MTGVASASAGDTSEPDEEATDDEQDPRSTGKFVAMLGLAAGLAAVGSTCGGVTDSRESARDKATNATLQIATRLAA